MSEQLSYASAIAELEQIVAKMQSDNCDIDSLSRLHHASHGAAEILQAEALHH